MLWRSPREVVFKELSRVFCPPWRAEIGELTTRPVGVSGNEEAQSTGGSRPKDERGLSRFLARARLQPGGYLVDQGRHGRTKWCCGEVHLEPRLERPGRWPSDDICIVACGESTRPHITVGGVLGRRRRGL